MENNSSISYVMLKPGTDVVNLPARPMTPRANLESFRPRFVYTWLFPVLHLVSYVALAVCLILLLDGYFAVAAESPRSLSGGGYRLRVSDVTTLISIALMIVKIFVSAWTSIILWNSVFVLLETQGLTLPQISRIMSYYLPPLPQQRAGYLVFLLLLFVLPQMFISPLLSGSVNWSPAFENSTDLRHVQSVSPGSSLSKETAWWNYHHGGIGERRAAVRRGAALGSIAWIGSPPDRHHCRHIMNDDDIPINSTILNLVMPCVRIHSITFPDAPPGKDILDPIQDSLSDQRSSAYFATDDLGSDRLSQAGDPPLAYTHAGNAVLFDPNRLPRDHMKFRGEERLSPSDFIYRGEMAAVVLINGTANCTHSAENIFGLAKHNNSFDLDSRCFSYGMVNFTAGVATSPTSKYIDNWVVEADLPDQAMELQAGRWVEDALYALPDMMSILSIINTTSLHTWGDLDGLEGYIDKLVRYAYQASWDMFSSSYETNSTDLQVQVAQSRVQASVSRPRVLAWLSISCLMTLSAGLLMAGRSSMCKRDGIFDLAVAALMTDSSEVLRRGSHHGSMDLSDGTRQREQLGPIKVVEVPGGRKLVFA
jgi:hypothetical protein